MAMKPVGGDMPSMNSKPATGMMPKLGKMGMDCIHKATPMGKKGAVSASKLGMTGSGMKKS